MKELEGILNQGLLRDCKNRWIVCSSSQGLPLAGAGAGDETLHEGVAVDAVAGLHLQYSTVQYSAVQYILHLGQAGPAVEGDGGQGEDGRDA